MSTNGVMAVGHPGLGTPRPSIGVSGGVEGVDQKKTMVSGGSDGNRPIRQPLCALNAKLFPEGCWRPRECSLGFRLCR